MSLPNGEIVSNQPSYIMLDLVQKYSDSPDTFPKAILAQATHLATNKRLTTTDILCSSYFDAVLECFADSLSEHPARKGVQSHLDISPSERLYYIVCHNSATQTPETLATEPAPTELGFLKLTSNSIHNFRHNQEAPTVIGIVYLQPQDRDASPRPALKVLYPSDSFIDYIPLSELGESFSIAKDVYTLEPSFEFR